MSTGWGFSEETNAPSTVGWGFETNAPGTSALPYSELEVQIVNVRNRTQRIMTTMPEFTTHLAQAGLEGPQNVALPGLDRSPWAKKIGVGAQFTVFIDTRRPDQDRVIKRVNVFDTYGDQPQKREEDANFRKQLFTIETEILALCHPPLREHRNIVTLFAWGYDYRGDSHSPSVPILYMERALCSLFGFLTRDDFISHTSIPRDTVGHQLCLDIAEGLAAMHKYGMVHGDIKPDNILIFPQTNLKVPYIAKLSDFGVCVALQGESAPTDFTVYRGTPGWRPPEAARYVEEIHGPFTPELLLRSDSFSYGLLVLSVLATGGHPPLSGSLEVVDQSLYSLQSIFSNAISILPQTTRKTPGSSEPIAAHGQTLPSPLDDALSVLDRATHVRRSLRTQIRSLLLRVLQLKPGDRDLVGSEMLADDEEDSYLDWRRQRDNQFQSPLKPVYKGQVWQRGTKYWLKSEPKLLRELDKQYDDLVKQGGDPRFPGETLHGMAIAHLSSESGKALHRANVDKALVYMVASALEGFYVAQGICERLHRGLGRTLPDGIDETVRSQWLYNAASTGSLLASEMLMQSDRNLWAAARLEFRRNGGYNDAHTRTVKAQGKLLEECHLAGIMKEHNINDYVVDIRGNRLLHLASMVGNVEATRSLLSLESANVNVRNDTGETPLLLACKAGHTGVVKLLVDSGADASIVSGGHFSVGPLHWLFNFEADEIPDIGRILVQKANAPINHRTTPFKVKALVGGAFEYPYGQIQAWHFPFEWPYGTALHWAIFSRSHAAIDILCEMGADVDALDLEDSDISQAPLSMAANRVDVQMVEHLLKKGASPTKLDRKDRNPLHFLSEDIGSGSRGLLGWRGLRDWILCGTSAEHRLKVDGVVKLLLEAGCDPEGVTIWNKDFPLTPLADATEKATMDANVTLSLVESGAKIDVPLYTGRSLLQAWAAVDPARLVYPDVHTTVLTTLIAKSSIEVLKHRDPLGRTFLRDIMANGWLPFQMVYEIVECYRVSGYPLDLLNSQDKRGYTALHATISNYRSKYKEAPVVQLVEALWVWGADLTAVSHDSLNPLHILGQNDWLGDLMTLHCLQLFKKNVPTQQFAKMVDQQDNFGHTPLMFMAKAAKIECVKWLVEEGVNTEALCTDWSHQDWTALDFVLHEAERYRRWFLVGVHVHETMRSEVHSYAWKAQSRSDDLQEDFPKVFQYLRSKGAKRGGELGLKTGGHNEPLGFDKSALGEYKMLVQTPEEWQFVYELESRPPKEPLTLVGSFLNKFTRK